MKKFVGAVLSAATVPFVFSGSAGATTGCTLNVHPVDGISRRLEVVTPSGNVTLLSQQGRNFPLPGGKVSFTVPGDTTQVRWVLLPSGWKTVLNVHHCVMEAYPEVGHAPSLSMTAPPPSTTTTAPPSTTTTVQATTTTAGPQATTTTAQATTTTTQATTTTTQATTTTTQATTTTTQVATTTTAPIPLSELPRTGGSLRAVWLALTLVAVGAAVTVAGWLERRRG